MIFSGFWKFVLGVFAVVLFLLPVGWGLWQQQNSTVWEPISLRGERIDKLAIGMRDGVPLVYAQTSTGLLRSVDDGRTWQTLDGGWDRDPFGRAGVRGWTMAAGDARLLYVVAYTHGELALFGSSDGGNTWILYPWRAQGDYKTVAIVVAPAERETIYMALDHMMLRSRDGGSRWVDLNWNGNWVNALAVDSADPDIVYAATDAGLWQTTDGGITWEAAPGLLPDPPTHSLQAAGSAGWAYAMQDHRLWQTRNSGRTWELTHLQPDLEGLASEMSAKALAIDPAVPDRVYLATEHSMYELQGDEVVIQTISGPAGYTILTMALALPDRDKLYAGTRDGLWVKSVRPPQPTPTPTFMPTATPTAMALEPAPEPATLSVTAAPMSLTPTTEVTDESATAEPASVEASVEDEGDASMTPPSVHKVPTLTTPQHTATSTPTAMLLEPTAPPSSPTSPPSQSRESQPAPTPTPWATNTPTPEPTATPPPTPTPEPTATPLPPPSPTSTLLPPPPPR